MNSERMELIGRELRRQRRMQDRTLQDVANAVGLKENTISAYEKGKIQIPIDNLDDICSYLGIDYIALLSQVRDTLMSLHSIPKVNKRK